jgi:hypothetical protein
MKLSPAARAELEEFFREFRGEGSLRLPAVKIHAGRAASWFTGRAGIGAITLGRHVLIAPRHLRRRSGGSGAVTGRLLAHEVAHVLQAERAGLLPFLFSYLREYLNGMRRAAKWDTDAHWRAYSEISFEREAREAERAFEVWRAGRVKT